MAAMYSTALPVPAGNMNAFAPAASLSPDLGAPEVLALPPKSAAKKSYVTLKRKREQEGVDDESPNSQAPTPTPPAPAPFPLVAHASVPAIAPGPAPARTSISPSGSAGKARDGQKKKKASRACVHCQKSHLTCDDARPCQRCVKRGMAESCTEGHRKKAKYLLTEEELEEIKKTKPAKRARSEPNNDSTPNPTSTCTPILPAIAPAPAPAPIMASAPAPQPILMASLSDTDASFADPLFSLAFDTTGFGSENSTLEYSILSAILAAPASASSSLASLDPLDLDAAARGPSPPPLTPSPPFPLGLGLGLDSRMSPEPYAIGLLDGAFGGAAPAPELEGSPEPYMQGLHDAVFSPLDPLPLPLELELELALAGGGDADIGGYRAPAPDYARAESPVLAVTPAETVSSSSDGTRSPRKSRGGRRVVRDATDAVVRGAQAALASPHTPHMSVALRLADAPVPPTAPDVYARVTAAFDYTGGYHALMKHLHTRFEKDDLLRIVRALAIIRPSLIALQMPLSEEDEVFVEKSFQRSLIEFEKLISFSGTPTVAWRRTGEVCLVGVEFSMLTDWSREELVHGNKYIWELFENSSVVEYWENFAFHAFENTTQSVNSRCTLVKPCGTLVPCTFCFSIRKDIFDLPSLIIGQWLPLL